MRRVRGVNRSLLFVLALFMFPAPSLALEVKFYRSSVANVVAGTATAIAPAKTGTGCVVLTSSTSTVATYGGLIEISDLGGKARACVFNGATTDEVRLLTAKIKVLAATRVVIEIKTTGELPNAASTGFYSFAAALKNVASFSSSNAPKTANGILERVTANSNDINQTGSVSVTCGTTSGGTVTWTSSSSCTRTENESLSLSVGNPITHISRYELTTTAANDFFTFPASGHAIISKVKDVDGGRLENCITLDDGTCTQQYPFSADFKFLWRSPLDGSRGSIKNNITANGNLLQATLLDSLLPLNCRSILSTDFEEDDQCSLAVATSAQWRDITVLKAKWSFTSLGNCAKSVRFMVELQDFRRFFFDHATDCTSTPTPSDTNIADRQNKAPNWDLSDVGGNVNETYSRSLALVGQELVRQVAIMLVPHPDDVTDQSIDLFNLVVNNNTVKPSTSVEFAPVPTNVLPLQGVEFRVTKEGDPTCVKSFSQENGGIRIIGGKYEAHINLSSCGAGDIYLPRPPKWKPDPD